MLSQRITEICLRDVVDEDMHPEKKSRKRDTREDGEELWTNDCKQESACSHGRGLQMFCGNHSVSCVHMEYILLTYV